MLIFDGELFDGVLHEMRRIIERLAGQLTIQLIGLSIISINPVQSTSRILRKWVSSAATYHCQRQLGSEHGYLPN